MDDLKFFPVSSFLHFYIYHPYGNTPPEDLLQSVSRAFKQPKVLLLGCGDLRSCFYTIWNNFYKKHSSCFNGVHFVLNDSSAGVLARNIIFLYLCTQMPTNQNDMAKWIASFWSIWYCHELLPHHKEVLVNAISQLLKWSGSIEDWNESTANPLKSLVQFATATTLSKIHEIWKMWYNDTTTVEDMRSSRAAYFRILPTENLQNPMRLLFDFFGGILLKNLTAKERNKMKEEIAYYFKNGFVFAEEMFGLPLEEPKSANRTFIIRSDGVYNLPCAFTPYRSYFFTFQFSQRNLENFDIDFPLMVDDEHFENQPLFANSVQLFSIWVRACAQILSQPQHHIVFTFQCSDALEFCQQLQNKPIAHLPQQFDAIYTSNLFDYLSPLSLVLLAMPILKCDGSLFTTLLYYRSKSNTSTESLRKHFGFDCKYLQLLCGVRCVGYENEYSDFISVRPVPSMFDIDIALCTGVRSFIWRHTTGMSLKRITESHFNSIWSVLSASIVNLLTCFSDDSHYFNCTGTVMMLLQSFATQVDKGYDCSSYQFWLPLCTLLLKQECLRCFVTSLQTQALLYGVHLHLKVHQTDCPLCNNQPVSQAVSHYSFIVQEDLFSLFKTGHKFAILLYSSHSSVNIYSWNSNSNRDVHVIDTFDASMIEEKLRVDFFAPTSFVQAGYCFSLVSLGSSLSTVSLGCSIPIMHGEIGRCQVARKYLFHQVKPLHIETPTLASLGEVLQHSGNDSSFETVIALNDQTMLALQNYQLVAEQCSDTTIKIKVNDVFINIFYPYSVDYGKLKIQLSRKKKKITIFANRESHYLYDEEPVFIINPENVLSLPIIDVSKADARFFCELQHNRSCELEDPHILKLKHGFDEYELKRTFLHLFTETDKQSFFLINKYDGNPMVKFYCLITVINRVFDMQNKVPAIDVLFCNTNIDEYLFSAFNPNKAKHGSIELDKAERELCTKVLNYFAKCTAATSMPVANAIYKSLAKKKVDHHFKRAVIYPLFPNIDENICTPTVFQLITHSLFKDPPMCMTDYPYWFHFFGACLKENKCSYCNCNRGDLMKCSKCHLVQYCGTDCQRKHWKAHKPFCNIPKSLHKPIVM